MFHPDKIVVNLQKMEFLCKREHGGNAGDKLKAFNQATGEFGLSRGGGGFFGKGRSKADSITGPLGTQIILFLGMSSNMLTNEQKLRIRFSKYRQIRISEEPSMA